MQLALKALEQRGFVERKPDPQHARILKAYLTDEGRNVATAVVGDAIAAHEAVFGILTAEEQRTLRDLLARVVEKRHRAHPFFRRPHRGTEPVSGC